MRTWLRSAVSIAGCYTLLFGLLVTSAQASDIHASITINMDTVKKFHAALLGNNCLGFESKYGFQHNAAGQWDHANDQPDTELLNLARNVGISVLRYPGGGGANHFNWKKTVGPLTTRGSFQFGLDEYLKLCKAIGAQPLITLGYFASSDEDLADLVEYLNTPINNGNPNGGVNWAQKRAENGHPEPYGVRFFELGNEIYLPDKESDKSVTAAEYATRYLRVRQKMRSVDQQILLGAVTYNSTVVSKQYQGWNRAIRMVVGEQVDFYAVHDYAMGYHSESSELTAEALFQIALASTEQMRVRLEKLSDTLVTPAGQHVPLALTEFNGGFVQYKPIPYRHCLGNALLNADILRMLAYLDRPLLCANYWHFANSFWGMVFNPTFAIGTGHYHKRPNYFVFELFKNFIGKDLVAVQIDCPAYSTPAYRGVAKTVSPDHISPEDQTVSNPQTLNPRLLEIKPLPGSTTHVDSGRITVSFDGTLDINYFNALAKLPIKPDHAYRVAGILRTIGLRSKTGIGLEVHDARGWSNVHWSISTPTLSGTNDWTKVEMTFEPVDELTNGIILGLRRIGGSGVIEGIAEVKDITVSDLGPQMQFEPTKYLSALAGVSPDRKEFCLLVINKHLTSEADATISISKLKTVTVVEAKVLHGKSIDATNEDPLHEQVTLQDVDVESIRLDSDAMQYKFKPHSVTMFILKNNP